MVEKDFSGLCQFNTTAAPSQQRNTDRVFQVPDLPAERGLRRVQPALGRNGQATLFRDSDEVPQVPAPDGASASLRFPSVPSSG